MLSMTDFGQVLLLNWRILFTPRPNPQRNDCQLSVCVRAHAQIYVCVYITYVHTQI